MKKEILQDKGVSGNAKLLYQYLMANNNCTLKNSELAEMFNVTPVSITLWLGKLETRGYVKSHFEKRKRTIVALEQE